MLGLTRADAAGQREFFLAETRKPWLRVAPGGAGTDAPPADRVPLAPFRW
jgi:hypothetical protein